MSRFFGILLVVTLVGFSAAFDFAAFRKAGGSAISWDARQIVSSEKFPCPDEGFYTHPTNCSRFYRCVDFTNEKIIFSRYLFECPEDHIFANSIDTCIPGNECKNRIKEVTPEVVAEEVEPEVVAEEVSPVAEEVVAEEVVEEVVPEVITEEVAPVAEEVVPEVIAEEVASVVEEVASEVVAEEVAPVAEEVVAEEVVEEVVPEVITEEVATVAEEVISEVITEEVAPVAEEVATEVVAEEVVEETAAPSDCSEDDGLYRQKQKYCNMFYRCNEKNIVYACNAGTAFSKKSQMCRLTAFDDKLCLNKKIFQINAAAFRDALSWNNVGVFQLDYAPVANSLPFSFTNIEETAPFITNINNEGEYPYEDVVISNTFSNMDQQNSVVRTPVSPIPIPVIVEDTPIEAFSFPQESPVSNSESVVYDHNDMNNYYASPIPNPVYVSDQLPESMHTIDEDIIGNLPSLENLLNQFEYDDSLHVLPYQNDLQSNSHLFKDQFENLYQVVDSSGITQEDIDEGNIVAAFTSNFGNKNADFNAGHFNQLIQPSHDDHYGIYQHPYINSNEGRYSMNMNPHLAYLNPYLTSNAHSVQPFSPFIRAFKSPEIRPQHGLNFNPGSQFSGHNPFFYNNVMTTNANNPYSTPITFSYQQPFSSVFSALQTPANVYQPQFVSNPSQFPYLLANPNEFASLLSNSNNQFPSLTSNPSQLTSLLADPNQFASLGLGPSQLTHLLSNPNQFSSLGLGPSQLTHLLSNPNQFSSLGSDSSQLPSLVANPNQFSSLGSDPSQLTHLLSNPSQLTSLGSNPSQLASLVSNQQSLQFPSHANPSFSAGFNPYDPNNMINQMAFNELMNQYRETQYKEIDSSLFPEGTSLNQMVNDFGIPSLNPFDNIDSEQSLEGRIPYGANDVISVIPVGDHELQQLLSNGESIIAALPESYPFHYYKKK